jgi:hypothetical protein
MHPTRIAFAGSWVRRTAPRTQEVSEKQKRWVIGAMADADARGDHILQRCDYDHEGQESGGNLVGARESRPAAAGTGAHRRLASIWACRYRDWRAHRGGSCLGPERSRGLPSAAKPAGEIDGTLRRNGSHTAAAAKTIEHLRSLETKRYRARTKPAAVAPKRDRDRHRLCPGMRSGSGEYLYNRDPGGSQLPTASLGALQKAC